MRPMTYFLTLILAATFPFYSQADENKSVTDCFSGLKTELIKGGYSGETDCNIIKTQIQKIGSIKTNEGTLDIYNFIYTINPPGSQTTHGGQKVLIFSTSNKYLGQYVLNPPPFYDLQIAENYLELKNSDETVDLKFDSGIPPKNVMIDGYIVDFNK